jgi:hypothetical protein
VLFSIVKPRTGGRIYLLLFTMSVLYLGVFQGHFSDPMVAWYTIASTLWIAVVLASLANMILHSRLKE